MRVQVLHDLDGRGLPHPLNTCMHHEHVPVCPAADAEASPINIWEGRATLQSLCKSSEC